MNGYSDYETSFAASMLDIGYVVGGVVIGFLTDLTYSRRTPLSVASIFLATILTVMMSVINPSTRMIFFVYIFFLGLLLGGAIAIVSGIACADLVSYTLLLN
jgi:sugar phosphate permease